MRRFGSACCTTLLLAAACGSADADAGAAAAPAGAPSWTADMAPLVHRACAPCHRPGEVGPFPLLTFADAHKRAAQLAEVTAARLMPPWLPSHGDFVGDRRLDAADVARFAAWAAAGAPRGAGPEPAPPQFPTGWQWREPDLVVVVPEPIDVPAAGDDLVRNLVIPLDLPGLRHVEAVEIRPGSPAVHHAVLAVDGSRESRRLDALDAEPGFPGMSLGGGTPPDGQFLGWTPGKQLQRQPAGMAFRLWPGQDLVLQLHLVPTGRRERVQPRLGFHFTSAPRTVEAYPLVLYSERIDIPAGVADYSLHDEFVLPVPVAVQAIYPHAHRICRRMRGSAVLPDGATVELFRIEAWDFDWQDDYRYREPVALPAGTRLAIDYVYDNSAANPHNPNRPPQRVAFGQRSADEMGTLTLSVTLASAAARRELHEATVHHDLQQRPWDFALWTRLAAAQRESGKLSLALESAEQALRLQAHPPAHAERGMALEMLGDAAAAERAYRAALAGDPALAIAHVQLGGLLARRGETQAAIAAFERALPLLPNLLPLHNNLATACFAEGQLDRAEQHYRQVLALDPQHFGATFNLGRVLLAAGRRDEARQLLQRAVQLRPGDPAVQQALREAAPR